MNFYMNVLTNTEQIVMKNPTTYINTEMIFKPFFEILTLKYSGDNEEFVYARIYVDKASNMPLYISISPSYESMDGEYRAGFMEYSHFKDAELTVEIDPEFVYKLEIPENSVGITYDIAKKAFDYLIYKSIKVSEYSHQNINKPYAEVMKMLLRKYVTGARISKYIFSFGHKIIPLTVKEVYNPYDIMYGAWRELYCNKIFNAMMTSIVGISVPRMASYNILADTNKDFFENSFLRSKFDLSDSINDTLDVLKTARINTDSKQFGDQLCEVYEEAQANISLSEYSLMMVMFSRGITLENLPALMRNHLEISSAFQIFKTKEQFSSTILDLFCSLDAIHNYDIIHNDLHLNNVTILYKKHSQIVIEGEHMLKKAYPYRDDNLIITDFDNIFASVIDFSRSHLGNKAVNFFGENYFEPLRKKFFFEVQLDKISQTIDFCMPGKKAYDFFNMEHLFLLLSQCDKFILVTNLRYFVLRELDIPDNVFTINEHCIPILDKLLVKLSGFISSIYNNLMKDLPPDRDADFYILELKDVFELRTMSRNDAMTNYRCFMHSHSKSDYSRPMLQVDTLPPKAGVFPEQPFDEMTDLCRRDNKRLELSWVGDG